VATPSTQLGPLPFGDFLEYLRAQGFTIGVDDYLRLQQLLARLGGQCAPADLKTLLCPIFATSKKEQQLFYRAFDTFFELFRLEQSADESPQVQQARSRWRSPLIYTIFAVLLITSVALVRKRADIERWIEGPPPPDPPALVPPPPTSLLYPSQSQPSSSPTITTKVSGTPLPSPSPSATPMSVWINIWKSFRDAGVWKNAILLALFTMPLFILAIYVVLRLNIYLYHLWTRYRRRWPILKKERGRKPSHFLSIRVESPELNEYRSEQFYCVVRGLRHRQASEFYLLDLERTITATVEARGYLTLRYQPGSREPEYLALIDRASWRDHQAQLLNHLALAMEREEILLLRCFFEGDPRLCVDESSGQAIHLADLQKKYPAHRLLIFGDGEQLIDPLSGNLASGAATLLEWPERAVLTPEFHSAWGLREKTLADHFTLLPATLNGLGELSECFNLQVAPYTSVTKQDGEPALPDLESPIAPNTVNELRHYLGEEPFQWLCACAIYPELQWDLTLYLGSLPCMEAGLINEENLLRLSRLPWFRTGSMPDNLRDLLLRELDQEKESAIRTAFKQLLEEDTQAEETGAADDRQLRIGLPERQSWITSFKEWIASLRPGKTATLSVDRHDYILVRFLASAPSSALDFVLPDRFRKRLYQSEAGFKRWLESMKSIVSRLSTPPLQPRHNSEDDALPYTKESVPNLELAKFIVTIIVGITIIWAFGLNSQSWRSVITEVCEWLRLYPPADLQPWDYWEIGALLWSAFTSVMFYLFTPEIDQSHFGEFGRSFPINRAYSGLLLFVMFVLHYGAVRTLFARRLGEHLVWLILIGLAFGLIDALNYFLRKHLKEKIEAVHSFLFADLPMIITFVIFLFFEAKYGRDKDTEVFLSGAISFQLFTATLIFAIIQGGVRSQVAEYFSYLINEPGLAAMFHKVIDWVRSSQTLQDGLPSPLRETTSNLSSSLSSSVQSRKQVSRLSRYRLTPLGKVTVFILMVGFTFCVWKISTGGNEVPGRSKERPLRVGVVTWPGYAGGIVANNGFKPNNTSIYGKHNLWVEFTLQEDVDVRNKLFAKGGKDGLDIVWSTVDFWANELPGLLSNGVKAKAIMQVDWSQGGDAIVGDNVIKKIEDLRGKKIALAQFTPSHWLLEYSLSNSGLNDAAQREVYNNLVFKTASPDALADFVTNKVDAAVVWEPDVEESKKRPNSHVIVSTQTITNIIADIMVAREDFIKAHPDVIRAFVKGWLEGTTEANKNPDKVVQLLMENEPVYKDLGAERTKRLLPTCKLADVVENVLMFGLIGGEPRFDKIFNEASKAWLKRGYIRTIIPPLEAKNDSFLRELYKELLAVQPEPCGPKPKGPARTNALPEIIERVYFRFAAVSAALDDEAKKTIDEQILLLVQIYPNAYIAVEGNTDNVGDPATNQVLSQQRAQAVVDYLVQRYRCHPERFIVKGNGDTKPVADNSTAEGRAKNRRTDIGIIPVQ
jgi:outer membrane protein OmpA-like peptidoglycan-associated protein/ABC-type nitrate/sulfonate/bicarbonate transport system substrate-binding protein/ABC-type amino acid transport system permease subunit